MQDVVIYTKTTCGYCHAAKDLLRRKGAAFTEIAVDADYAAQQAMSQRAQGRTSVPQIFISGQYVGGCDDLHALERAGKLDKLLSGSAQ